MFTSSTPELMEEIAALLQKGAIKSVSKSLKHLGFYSKYFDIPKRDSCKHTTMDLRELSRHIK